MKLKTTKDQTPPQQEPFRVRDKVLTPISTRQGEIVRIEEKSFDGIRKLYTVCLPMPVLDQPWFKDVFIELRESELRRVG